jgi:hypothetical protein
MPCRSRGSTTRIILPSDVGYKRLWVEAQMVRWCAVVRVNAPSGDSSALASASNSGISASHAQEQLLNTIKCLKRFVNVNLRTHDPVI